MDQTPPLLDAPADPTDPRAISVEFDETLEDAFAHSAFVYTLPWWRREGEKQLWAQRKSVLTWSGMLALLGYGVVGVIERPYFDHAAVFGAIAGAVTGLAMWGKVLTRAHWNKRVRLHREGYIRAQGFGWPRRAGLCVTPRGVIMTWGAYQIRSAWKHMYGVYHDAGRVIVVMGNGSGMSIPDAAFRGTQAAAAFAGQANVLMSEAGETNAQRLAKYLAENDAACPKCKYPLRGVKNERCPECGRAIDHAELTEIAAKRSRTTRSFRLTQ